MIHDLDKYLDGLMLSDGCISARDHVGFRNARYTQVCKYKEWLEVIKTDFSFFGIRSNIGGTFIKYNNTVYPLLTSCFCDYFYEMYKRWYSWSDDEGWEYEKIQKTVPKDIELTPECIANWYFGDGCLWLNVKQNHYVLSLTTSGFKREDVMFLSSCLSEILDIDCHIDKSKNSIRVFRQKDIASFLHYIKDFRVDCYDYKYGVYI